MSKQFVGFSDDDIYKITRQTNGKDAGKNISRPHAVRLGKAKPVPVAVAAREHVQTNNADSSTATSCVDSSIYPAHPIQQAVAFKPLPAMMNAPEDESILILPNQQKQLQPMANQGGNVLCSIEKPSAMIGVPTSTPAVAQETVTPFKGMSLKDFEQQRRLMQEQNRQKRDILQKAIEQHTQKTAAEANKLQDIKSELAKLDSDLASDVAILRKQIDAASLHFSNVEKNYLNIENLFLKAKVDLHQALERKEMLTEHLCTIISHNEERKAKRLSELMEKVGLSVNGDITGADETFAHSDVSSSQVTSTVDYSPRQQ